MNLLLAGSGAIDLFCARPDSLLIVPTATMAEHTRHKLVRSGFALRPQAIRTLAHVLNDWSPLGEAGKPLVHFLITQALDRIRPARFAAVAGFPGFVRALAELLDEIPNAEALSGDLAQLFVDVEQELGTRSLAFRNARVRVAAQSASFTGLVVFDGFFTLAAAEVELVLALSKRTDVAVTLPAWSGADQARQSLLAAGFVAQLPSPIAHDEACGAGPRPAAAPRAAHPQAGPIPQRSTFSAPTIEREIEEIARRILDHSTRGRLFREIAIVLRSRHPYGPLVETTLARFGIPMRSYFHDPLGAHPAMVYLASLVRAILAGWDHTALLAALRMPVSGIGATPIGDQLDFEWREKLPGIGLPLPAVFDRLAERDTWRRERHEPPEWAARLKTLRAQLPAPEITDRVSREQLYVWRSTAAALVAFDEALDGAACALRAPCSLEIFWKQVELALKLEALRVPDLRRNVVHVMDAHEARQWELPVVFVCGLTERHFPQYHREDSILGDAARKRMGLDTAASRQAEERFLFDTATTRATEETVLSYPRYDEKGEETLPSFFLEDFGSSVSRLSAPLRSRFRAAERKQTDRPALGELHKTLSASSIESFLQCPFQFFARKTLRLRRRPPAPRDRLDVLLQGTIIHGALAEWVNAQLLGTAVLEQVFDEECARARIPPTYRMEAVRLELLRNFRGFLEDRQVALSSSSVRTEQDFNFPLNPQVAIRGRIDRMDVGSTGEALVIDYKYSAEDQIRKRVKASDKGEQVQGGLYLLAAERFFGFDPAGMLFCGLKKDVTWDGWHRSVPELASVGTACTRDMLRDLMQDAERAAIKTHEEIASGRIAVSPADPDKCKWCDYVDICRVESIVAVKSVGGA